MPRSRTRSRSRSVSKSRSRSRTPRRSRSRSRSRSRGRGGDNGEGHRVHVGDIDPDVTARTLEDKFSKFGPLREVWIASYPPWFAFIVFKFRQDAEDAVAAMDGAHIGRSRARVSHARPRGSGGGGGGGGGPRMGGYPPPPRGGPIKCFECGGYGHIGRECRSGLVPRADRGGGYRRRSYSRSRSPRPRKSSRSRSRTYSRSPRR